MAEVNVDIGKILEIILNVGSTGLDLWRASVDNAEAVQASLDHAIQELTILRDELASRRALRDATSRQALDAIEASLKRGG